MWFLHYLDTHEYDSQIIHFDLNELMIGAKSTAINQKDSKLYYIQSNPVNDHLILLSSKNAKEPIDLVIYSSTGSRIIEEHIVFENEYIIDVSQLSNGSYFISIFDSENLQQIKFIKSN